MAMLNQAGRIFCAQESPLNPPVGSETQAAHRVTSKR